MAAYNPKSIFVPRPISKLAQRDFISGPLSAEMVFQETPQVSLSANVVQIARDDFIFLNRFFCKTCETTSEIHLQEHSDTSGQSVRARISASANCCKIVVVLPVLE